MGYWKRLAICAAGLLLIFSAAFAADFEQPYESWDNVRTGVQAGDSVDRDGAIVTDPVVTELNSETGKKSVCFNFTFNPLPGARVLEAEKARLVDLNRYHDALASGGAAVSGLGNTSSSAVIFERVPPSDGMTIVYNNTLPQGWRHAHPKTTQCGLFVDGRRVTTLKFKDPGGFYTPYSSLVYEGKVGGSVRLQADPADIAANHGACCNIDKIILGPAHPLPSIEVRLKMGGPALVRESVYLSCAIRAPEGFTYQLGVEDGAAVQHWSRMQRQQRQDGWEHITVVLHELMPQLDPAKAGAIKAILIRASGDEAGLKGTAYVDDVKFSALWPSNPPAGTPFAKSSIAGLCFTGCCRGYTSADNWYPTWAADGNLYSPYTDGKVNDELAISGRPDASVGMARIEGNDPMKLKVCSLGTFTARPWPFSGRYPTASLIYNGIWYYGTSIINSSSPDGTGLCQGPFVGFRTSADLGKSWTDGPHTPLSNLFGEQVDQNPGGGIARIKMSTPHFVDFGQNMKDSPDGKAYLVAHGCTDPASPQTWFLGDEIYLARVTPDPKTINDASKYEFFSGNDDTGQPLWTSQFSRIKPLFSWPGRTGCVTVTYNAPLKKYLMCVSTGENKNMPFDTYILEADRITGPWKLISYMEQFGKQAFFVNIPSKFISRDGLTMWLCYSANWGGQPQNPRGSFYALCFQEMKLIKARQDLK